MAGDSGVGKSSILLRYCSDEFNLEQKMTIGIEFRSHDIEVKNFDGSACMWRGGGQWHMQIPRSGGGVRLVRKIQK